MSLGKSGSRGRASSLQFVKNSDTEPEAFRRVLSSVSKTPLDSSLLANQATRSLGTMFAGFLLRLMNRCDRREMRIMENTVSHALAILEEPVQYVALSFMALMYAIKIRATLEKAFPT